MSHFDEYNSDVTNPDGRALGDEWANWDGRDGGTIKTGKGLFIFFSGLVVLLICAAILLFVYLISPRLSLWNSYLPSIAWGIAIAFNIALIAWEAMLVLTMISGKRAFPFRRSVYVLFDLVFSRTFGLARIFGVSRDKIGHSFVNVSNAISRALKVKGRQEKLLILLPRCLSKEELKAIIDLKNTYPIEVHTVSGGELARKKVKELKPTAVIGVACERDLVSGIRDVAQKISVIGIPNKRPEGPCKNTHIDMQELIAAIEFYIGPSTPANSLR